MRLPIIKQLLDFVEERDNDFILETIETLEYLTEVPALKDEELDVIGEMLSNMYGTLEVRKAMAAGTPRRKAMNDFMGRVLGSIDQ